MKNLVYWGVSIEEELALSDSPVLTVADEDTEAHFFSGAPITFASTAEKEFFLEQASLAERRAQVQTSYVSYPVIAGSNGITVNLKKRYDLVLTPMTWEDANDKAQQLPGSRFQLSIQS